MNSKIMRTVRRVSQRPPALVRTVHVKDSVPLWDYLMRIAAIPEPRARLLQASDHGRGREGGGE